MAKHVMRVALIQKLMRATFLLYIKYIYIDIDVYIHVHRHLRSS